VYRLELENTDGTRNVAKTSAAFEKLCSELQGCSSCAGLQGGFEKMDRVSECESRIFSQH
jgi:hypothetical protein